MGKRIALTIYLALPFFIIAFLMWMIAGSLERQASTSKPAGAEPMSLTSKVAAATAQPEDGVQPETLEQGYIIVANDPQKLADANSPIYLGTNYGNWHPGTPEFQMSPRSDGKWQIVLEKPTEPGRMQFKFTRGTWETVQVSAENEQIDNLVLPTIDPAKYADGSKPIFEFTVEKWADQLPGATQQRGIEDTSSPLEVTGTAHRLEVIGGAGRASGMVRDAIVWLPPGYEHGDRSYPVLYMMDGQHAFMQQPGAPSEWSADETATELIEAGAIEPIIIVAIPSSGFSRADEYLPVALVDGVQPSADAFISWMEHSVMPRVERAYRVKTGPENTAIAGASFGGVLSLYAASQRPDLFGAAIVESPSVLSKDNHMLDVFTSPDFQWPSRVVLGMGTKEAGTSEEAELLNARYNAAGAKLQATARAAGSEVAYLRGEGHVHNEQAWAERFPMALKHLYGTE